MDIIFRGLWCLWVGSLATMVLLGVLASLDALSGDNIFMKGMGIVVLLAIALFARMLMKQMRLPETNQE